MFFRPKIGNLPSAENASGVAGARARSTRELCTPLPDSWEALVVHLRRMTVTSSVNPDRIIKAMNKLVAMVILASLEVCELEQSVVDQATKALLGAKAAIIKAQGASSALVKSANIAITRLKGWTDNHRKLEALIEEMRGPRLFEAQQKLSKL